jgi:hypothetical protein
MNKTKRMIAAVTAAIITAASTSLMSVGADENVGSDLGFVSKSATDKSGKIEKVESDAQLYDKLGQLLKQGDYLKYGEALYTTGTPDGEKWTKEFYEQRVEFFGEDLLSKYIVDGEFLRKSVESDMNGLLIKTANELDKYVDVINEFLTEKSIAGSAYLIKSDGIDKLLITYDGNLDKIKAFVNETGLDENLVVYSQAQDMVVTTIAVTETKPATTITMPVLDEPNVKASVATVKIMDVSGDTILVKPVDGSIELKSSDKFSLSAKQLPADITPKAGMMLEITYNGGILETYPAMFDNIQKVTVVTESDTVKEDVTLLKGTKDMTMKDVIELAKKGNDLDWSDFKDFNGRDVGSGLYIWEFKLEDGYVLDVGGTTDKKPIYILLSHDNDKGIDIRTEDVKEYIASTATPVVTENEEVEAVMLLTESGYDGCYINLEFKSGTFSMSGSIYQSFAVFGKFERKGNDLYLYAENGSTNVYVLHRENDHFISQSDEKGIKLSKGLVFTADNDTFWEKLLDLTPPEKESNNTGKTQEYSFDDILNMSTDELNKLFESKGMTMDKGFKVFSPDNTVQAYSVCISPKTYMQSVKGDELITEVKDANDIYKLFTDGDVIWNINKIYSSLGISPELFEIKANVSVTHATGSEETGIVYRNYCRCFLTPITTDKETYNTLLAAALNYVQLNPDFVGIFFEAPGAGNGMNIPLTVNENVKGDANCDGELSMADAVLIMQSIANPAKFGIKGTNENHLTEQGSQNADIAGDNDGITNADALAVQKKLLGLDKTDVQSIDSSLIANKLFVYEKSADPGIYDDLCTLSFGSNGTYAYNIGYYRSSNQDQGIWTISGDTLVLTGQYGINKFRYEDKALVYIAEGSDGFSDFNDKSTPKDGEKFYLAEEPDYAAINNLPEIVTIKSDYNPIMSDRSGIGILLEFDSKDYSISLRTDDGHFTTWDIAKGSGPIENVGTTYKIGNSGYIFWTPDDINFDADYRNEIVIIGEKDGKSVKLGNIVVTPSNSHTLTAVLK